MLLGSDNVQGRLLNGVAAGEVCKTPALSYSGRFIHIEQKPDPNDTKKPGSFRDARNWVDAINDTWAFTVLGTVTCQATRPISDVEVYVWKRGKGSGFVGDVTDSSGTYRVTLEEGTYDLIFNPRCGSGCASKAYKGVSGLPDLTLNVVLSPGYTISGTVFATDGVTPVEGVSIYAFNHETADGFGLPLTEADGHYCIGLITGTYDLGFTPPPCRGLGPRTVVTTVNQDMPLDVILPPGFTVAGCVTDGLGKPVPGVQIYANDPNIGGFGLAPTNESGCYMGTLPYAGSPPTGVYDVQFIPPPRPRLGSLTIIDMTSTTSGCPNTTLPITLPAGFTLSGRVTCNGKGIKNVYVYALPQGPQDPNNSLPGYSIFTVDDGSYGLPLVSGTYRLEFTPPLATGLNARAFTTTQILTDTVLDVNFCVCSGAWVTETVDGVGNVGNDGDTSLALAPTYPYTPHISYYSVSSQSVKHAWLSGAIWLSHTVWPRYVAGQISLALVPTYPYTPCIAHYDRAYWGVQFAYWDDTTWVSQVVEAGHFQGEGGVSLALAPVYPYTPHVSYNLAWNVDDLKYAYLSGTTWMSGTWVRTTVDSSGTVGSDNSLALEQTYPYTPHISYYDDYTNGDVKHAWLSSTTWLTETVDSEGSVGRWSTSLALDSDGDPHISYLDSTNLFSFDLKYAWRSGTTWLTETVDSEGDVGRFTSLALDGRGNPHISYYGRTPGGLKYARFDNRVWIVQTVDSGIDVGRHSSLALDPAGCPNISYYNAPHGELKYAHIPPRYLVYLPLVMRNYP